MLAIDHVILVVDDLEAAAARLEREHGLGSVPGGRHPGHGTGNRIIPLGDDYVELMAVVDRGEAAASSMGRWAMALAGPDAAPAAVCLRTDDIDTIAARLGLEAAPMSRQRPDGVTLSWRLCGFDPTVGQGALPFFIQWEVPAEHHPGRAEARHAVETGGITWVEVGGDPAVISDRIGGADLPLRATGGGPGVHRLAVATAGGEIVLGGPSD